MCIQPDEEHGMGVIGLVKSIRCESTSEPAQDAPWWSEWPVSHQLHRTEDLLDQGSTNHRLLGGREEHAGHAVGCPSRWEPPVPWPKRIRAGYAELLKPCAERAPDEGDIEDKVLAKTWVIKNQ